MEYGQFLFPSTLVSQDNLFQERSHSQSKWGLWWSVNTTTFSFSFKTKFINVIVIINTFIVFPIIIYVSLFSLKGSSGDHSFYSSMEYGQFPFLSTSVPQDNLFQERSHSQSKWDLWWSVITTTFRFSCKIKFIIVIIITIIVFPIIIMLCFQRHKLCSICKWLSLYLDMWTQSNQCKHSWKD